MLLIYSQKLNLDLRGGVSIFDRIEKDDVILAFFPCIYFEAQSQLWFAGNNFSQKNWSVRHKCESNIERHESLHKFYVLLNKLVCICEDRGLRMVIENPYTQPHYLTSYWCIKPDLIDKDRTNNGDYFKKPTQYWFFGFKPKHNIVFEALDYVEEMIVARLTKKDGVSVQTQRSMIHPQYASRFIRQFVLDEKVWNKGGKND
jgi:hypothetical protein